MRVIAPILTACAAIATAGLVFVCVVRAFVPYHAVQAAPAAYQTGYAARDEREQWSVDFAAQLGNVAPSQEMVALLTAWQIAEDSCLANCDYNSAFMRHNPLNTTMPGYNETGIHNSVGVRAYATYADGLAANVDTLDGNYQGYSEIKAGIQSNDIERTLRGIEVSPWCPCAGYAGNIRALYTQLLQEMERAAPPVTQDDTPRGNPLGMYPISITQGYGVGTHAPAAVWGGIDLAADEGTPIYATVTGSARLVPNSYPAGNYLSISNEHYKIAYAHLSAYAVENGASVQAGDLIGYVGTTGMATGAHLHYEVWADGANVNPLDYLGELK